MNKDKIEQRISAMEQELVQLRQQLKDEPQFLFEDRLESYTLEEVNDIVADFNSAAEFAVRTGGQYAFGGIFLGCADSDECPWKIVKDNDRAWVLVLKDHK